MILNDLQILEYYNHKYGHNITSGQFIGFPLRYPGDKRVDGFGLLEIAKGRNIVYSHPIEENVFYRGTTTFVGKEDPKWQGLEQLVDEAEKRFENKA